jgi:hypothetical protein
MNTIAVLAAAADTSSHELPPVVYGIIAGIVFLSLAVVTWSYRDVAHRHQEKSTPTSAHAQNHTGH